MLRLRGEKKRKLIEEKIVQIKKSKNILEKLSEDCMRKVIKVMFLQKKELAFFSTGTALRKSVKDKEEQISKLEKSLEKNEALLKST